VTALFRHSFGAFEEDWFELVAAGGVVPHKKPAPDIYNYALDRMGLPADACFALEDSENGMQAAHAAGIDVLITVNRYTDRHDFTGAAVVLDHLGEPAMPCHKIEGDLPPVALVDTEYLRRLHAHCQAARR